MKKSPLFFLVLLAGLLVIALAACNMPALNQPTPAGPDAAFTAAAQTIAAQLTQIAQQATPTPNAPAATETPAQPTATFTVAPTNTPAASPTFTSVPCLMVGFNNSTIDQTIPDGTVMSPGQVFVKTWRLINMGACTWTSSYQLVFDHGDSMGVPANYAQTLTSSAVGPYQTVDVSVQLTAPSNAGTYTGYWRFRDPNMNYFGIGGTSAWVVKIKVVNSLTATLTPVVGKSGSLLADSGPGTDYSVGESPADNTKIVELFLTYDISAIPTNATITEVKVNFSEFNTPDGNPFGLGVLNGYVTDFGPTLETTDFVTGFPPGNSVDWGSTTVLSKIEASPELKTALQKKLGTGRFQLRLQFPGSNNDGVLDRITFTNPSLQIKYVTP